MISGFEKELDNLIIRYSKECQLTTGVIIGVLEVVKIKIVTKVIQDQSDK